jgi:hypothetical protein
MTMSLNLACKQSTAIHFLCSVKDGEFEEVLSYSQLMDSLESQDNGEGNVWKFCQIIGHQASAPHGFKRIQAHLIYDVKHNSCHKARMVALTHYYDANLFHDIVTGHSVTGILHLLSKTPLDWYSKKQATVETATYGSEFVAACTCVDQIINLHTTLVCYIGVPIRDKSYVFGDNKIVVDSSTILHVKLHKHHNVLSFHHVPEAIAAKFIAMHHLDGIFNPTFRC